MSMNNEKVIKNLVHLQKTAKRYSIFCSKTGKEGEKFMTCQYHCFSLNFKDILTNNSFGIFSLVFHNENKKSHLMEHDYDIIKHTLFSCY